MLIVNPDSNVMSSVERKKNYGSQDFPSYYHSGLCQASERVVDRRFSMRIEKSERFYSRTEVSRVEQELMDIMRDRLNVDTVGGGSVAAPVVRKKYYKKKLKKGENAEMVAAAAAKAEEDLKKTAAEAATESGTVIGDDGTITEIVQDIVSYEPWMDDYGRIPSGSEFEEDRAIAKGHPEIWLEAKDYEIGLSGIEGGGFGGTRGGAMVGSFSPPKPPIRRKEEILPPVPPIATAAAVAGSAQTADTFVIEEQENMLIDGDAGEFKMDFDAGALSWVGDDAFCLLIL